MKKVRVKKTFHDMNDFSVVYEEGDVVEFEDARADIIVDFRYGEYVGAKEPTTTKDKIVVEPSKTTSTSSEK